jgi:tRNA A-37 threonylcarbamoyl transferase component Bud32
MRDLPVGTQIGPYRIVRVAGRGAVGIVYLAEHSVLGKPVAIKTLNPSYADESIFRERFTREAQGAAAVSHPNIITVFDAGEHERIPYLVMAFVDGPDLEQVLADRGGRLEPAEAILICALIADALDAAGAAGLAHRDVKPANILLEGWEPERYGGPRRRPHAYLTDFGLIKSSAQATVTMTGQFVGTLLYMSPEQIQSKAIPASDQYSLACVLWECLTGTLPYEPTGVSTLSVLSAHLNDPIPRISERPGGRWTAELDRVFERALAKRPEDRYPSCSAFMDAATRALGLGAAAPKADPAPPASAAATEPLGRVVPDVPLGAGAGGPLPPLAGATATGPVPGVGPGRDTGTYTPAGLPPSLAPPAGGDGSRTWIVWAVLGLIVVAAVLAAVALSGDGGGDAEAGTDASSTATAQDGADQDGTGQDGTAQGSLVGAPSGSGQLSSAASAAAAEQGRIAFVADGEVWVAAADGSGATDVTGGAHPGARQPAWRPGADELAVSTEAGIVLLAADGSGAEPLTDDGAHADPAWSPDGQVLAFTAPADGGSDVVLRLADGTLEPQGLTDDFAGEGPAVVQRPAFSPDGRHLAMHVTGGARPLQVAVLDLEVGDVQVVGLPEGAEAFHPSWTPDGRLVFTLRQGEHDTVVTGGLDGAELQTLIDLGDVDAKDADVSPCGDWLVYQVDADGGPYLVVAGDGGEGGPVPLPDGVGEASDPAWSGQPCPA